MYFFNVLTNTNCIVIYWVPENSRNNSMGQCQLMLENNEKKIKNSIPLRFDSSKGAAFISFTLNIKKDFDYVFVLYYPVA
jgi:hypothetical protein